MLKKFLIILLVMLSLVACGKDEQQMIESNLASNAEIDSTKVKNHTEVVDKIISNYKTVILSDEYINGDTTTKQKLLDTQVEVCESLTNDELLSVSLAYPLIVESTLWDNPNDGFESLKKHSNVVKTLLERENIDKTIKSRLEKMTEAEKKDSMNADYMQLMLNYLSK